MSSERHLRTGGYGRIRARKRNALDLRDLAGPHLTPGPYFVDHLGHMRHVRHGRWRTDVAKAQEASGLSGLEGAIRRMVKWTAAAASPPTLMWLRPSKTPLLEKELLGIFALPTAGGNAVLLSQDGSSVVRVYRGGTVSLSEALLRPHLEQHLRISRARILTEHGLIIEPYVTGRNYRHLASTQRQRIFRRLLLGYAELVREHAGRTQPSVTQLDSTELERSVAAWRFPPGMGAVAWDHLQDPVPTAPSHGDVCSDNLLTREDGSFTLIDFERCAQLPFYYDALNLVLCESKEGRHDLATGLLGGLFDAEFQALWAAAEMRYSPNELWRALSLAFLLHLRIWKHPRYVDWSGFTAEGTPRK